MSKFVSRVRFRLDHRWAPDRMSAYLDEELESSRRPRMERHTEACAECRRLLDGLRRMLGTLHRLPTPDGGTNVLQIATSVRARLRELPPS